MRMNRTVVSGEIDPILTSAGTQARRQTPPPGFRQFTFWSRIIPRSAPSVGPTKHLGLWPFEYAGRGLGRVMRVRPERVRARYDGSGLFAQHGWSLVSGLRSAQDDNVRVLRSARWFREYELAVGLRIAAAGYPSSGRANSDLTIGVAS
jgi:hypothetical protein